MNADGLAASVRSRVIGGCKAKRGQLAMRVLLIEDEPTTAKAIELMLTTEGFNVYSTDLGEEGLDLGKLYDYDIILLDLNLPDMHGYDVLKKLRVAKVQTPVLILSGISRNGFKGPLASALVPTIMSPSRSTAKNWSPAFTPLCAVPRAIRNRSSAPASWRSTLMPRPSKSMAPAST